MVKGKFTRYSKEVIEAAAKLYVLGETLNAIARTLKVSSQTIYKWRDKYEWEDRKTKVDEKALEKANDSLAEIKKRQKDLIVAAYGIIAERMKKRKLGLKAANLVPLMKHELTLAGEADKLDHTGIIEVKWLDPEPIKKKKKSKEKKK